MLNWASICKNHTVGSVGQNGGSLMLTAARVGEGAGVAAASVGRGTPTLPSLCMPASSVVAMVEMVTSWSSM